MSRLSMGDFLIVVGLLVSFIGMIVGPIFLSEKIKNNADAKAASFLGMLPGALLMFIGSFFK